MQDTFSAYTKYNDYRGSVAADGHDNYSILSLLEAKKLIRPGERIVGVNVGSSNPSIGNVTKISLCAYLASENAPDGQIRAALNTRDDTVLRMVELSITPGKFFSLFKRFDLAMSKGGSLNGLPLHYHTNAED